MKTLMTYQEAAQTALDVQDACNLSGVVHSFADVVSALRNDPACTGTNWVNNHPIVTLFLDKLCDLNGRQDFFTVIDEVKRLAGKE